MEIGYARLKQQAPHVSAAMAAARSARNLQSRRQRSEAGEERAAEAGRRRAKARRDREADAFLKRKIRVKVAKGDRPRNGSRTPHRLYHRALHGMLKGSTGFSDSRGPDRLYSLHFAFVARGFASRKGRRWRAREAERAALYAVREDALEGGEAGWWSNIATDRNEHAAHYRASEELEKHDRSNANVYVTEVIALPAELTARQRRLAVRRICRWFEARGLAYTVGIHLPDATGDQRNYHVHVIYSLRPCERLGAYDWNFAVAKQNDINTPAGILARRQAVVRAINATLHAAGIDKRYTHLGNKARGMAAGQGKMGQQAVWAARRLAALAAKAAKLERLQEAVAQMRQSIILGASRLDAVARGVAAKLETTIGSVGAGGAVHVSQFTLHSIGSSVSRHLGDAQGRVGLAAVRANRSLDGARDSTDALLVGRALEVRSMAENRRGRLRIAGERASSIGELEKLGDWITGRAGAAGGRVNRACATLRQVLDAVGTTVHDHSAARRGGRLAFARLHASRQLADPGILQEGPGIPTRVKDCRSIAHERLSDIGRMIAPGGPHRQGAAVRLFAIRQQTGEQAKPSAALAAVREAIQAHPPSRGSEASTMQVAPEAGRSGPAPTDTPVTRLIEDSGKPAKTPEQDVEHQRISAGERNALLRAQLADREADVQRRLRRAAWQLLVEQGAMVTRDRSDNYLIDTTALSAVERRALLDPAFAAELQERLAGMFAQQVQARTTPAAESGTPRVCAPIDPPSASTEIAADERGSRHSAAKGPQADETLPVDPRDRGQGR